MMGEHLGIPAITAIVHLQPEEVAAAIDRYAQNNQALINNAKSEAIQSQEENWKKELQRQQQASSNEIENWKNQFQLHQQSSANEIAQVQAKLQEHEDEKLLGSALSAPKDKLKLDVPSFHGKEGENLERWKVEVDLALYAARIQDPSIKIAFAMSHLASRARDWAYGRKMTQSNSFPTLKVFYEELGKAFQPPNCEFRLRSQFLSLRQGKSDLYGYIQRARYLVAGITSEPLQEQTKLTVFLNGLNQGPVRMYLYRSKLESMEHAIALSLEEDFSQKAANRVGFGRSDSSDKSDSDKMDLSNAQPNSTPSNNKRRGKGKPGQAKSTPVDKANIVCRRCQKTGHYASECRAPAPVPAPANRGFSRQFAAANVEEEEDVSGTEDQLNGTSQ